MLNASKKARLINDNTDLSLFFVLESEAAGIFYFSDLNTQVDSEQEEEELNNPFIICDIGGGTVDICTLKKDTKKDGLIEEYPPMGGDYGGNYINKDINSSENILDYYIYEYNKRAHNINYELKRDEKYEWYLIIPSQIFLHIIREIAGKIFLKLLEIEKNIFSSISKC